MKKSRLLVAVLAILMLVSSFASCGGGNGGDTTADTTVATLVTDGNTDPVVTDPPVTEPPAYVGTGEKYDGATFTVLISSNAPETLLFNDFKYNEENGTVLDEAVHRKNAVVEEEYDVVIDYITNCNYGNTAAKEITEQYTANDNAYQLLAIGSYDTIPLAYGGTLYDLNSLPNLNSAQSYWDQNANEQLTIHDVLFFTNGAISVWDDMQQLVIMFNKELIVEDNGDIDVYELVKEGKWTYDKLDELAKNSAEDMNGDDDLTMDDKFGILLWDDTITGVLASTGGRMVVLNEQDDLELDIYDENSIAAIDKFTALANKEYVINYQRTTKDGNVATKMLSENRAIFFLGRLQTFDNIRDFETPFGILPYPKMHETQDSYHSSVFYYYANFYATPNTTHDIEMRGAIMNALAYYSGEFMTPAYMERTLVGKHFRDEESEFVLDILLENRIYDIGFCALGGSTGMVHELLEGFRNLDASYIPRFDSVKRVSERSLSSINKRYDEAVKEWNKQ